MAGPANGGAAPPATGLEEHRLLLSWHRRFDLVRTRMANVPQVAF
jgi:hypothetical protein